MQCLKVKMSNQNRILLAKVSDADEIMKFIDREWKKGHLLSTNKDFFLYEYKNKDKLNFVISKNKSNEINGILGFLKASLYPDSLIWTTMWKVAKNSGSPMLGIDILNFLRKQGFKNVMSLGINFKTIGIYEYLGFHVGVLDHYYIPNEKIKNFKISKFQNCNVSKKSILLVDNVYSFKKLKKINPFEYFDFDKYNLSVPFKDLNYFNHRYIQHPVYNYDLYGSFKGTELLSIVVVRVSSYQGSTCMRIVDFYGEEETLSCVTQNLVEEMYTGAHEYIDLYCLGLSAKILIKAGFIRREGNKDDVVIPNYFEPFVQENIPIRYFTDSKDLENLRIFKADGDQDRPSYMAK